MIVFIWPRIAANGIDSPLQLSLNEVNRIDIAFDGADEVDSQMNLIKVCLSYMFVLGLMIALFIDVGYSYLYVSLPESCCTELEPIDLFF